MARVGFRAIFTLYFIVLVDFMQISFVWPLLPKIVEEFHGGATQVGILGSVAAAGEAIAAPYLGILADKIGRRPVFIVAMIGCTISTLFIGFAESYLWLVVARTICGICGGTASVAAAYIADVTTEEERPDYMTKFQAALFAGLSFGPVLGGFMNSIGGYPFACFVAAGVCALNVVSVVFFLPDSRLYTAAAQTAAARAEAAAPLAADPVPAGDAPGPAGETVAGSDSGETGTAVATSTLEPPVKLPLAAWIISVASFFNGVGFCAFEALGVMYLQDSYFDENPEAATLFWSWIISGVGIIGFITNIWLYSPIQRRLGLKGTIWLGGALSTVSFFCLGVRLNKWWFFGWTQVIVFGENVMGTSVQTIITVVVDPSMFGRAIGVMTFFGNIARAAGPFAFGPVYEHVGHSLPWFVNSGLKVVAVFLCALAPQKQPPAAGYPEGAGELGSNGVAERQGTTVSSGSSVSSAQSVSPTVRQVLAQSPASFRILGTLPQLHASVLARSQSQGAPPSLVRSQSHAATSATPERLQATRRWVSAAP